MTESIDRMRGRQGSGKETTVEMFGLLVGCAEDFAIFTTDPDGVITSWNPGVFSLLGYGEEQFVGQNISMLYTPTDREDSELEQEMVQAISRGRVGGERWYLKNDGTRFRGYGVVVVLRDDRGAPRGFGRVLRDVTERTRVEQALRDVTERVRAEEEALRSSETALQMASTALGRVNARLKVRVADLTAELARANARWRSEAERSENAERERCSLLTRLVSVQEEERRQIARELHDRMGPNLAEFAHELKALSDACPEYERMAPVLERLRSVATELGKQTHHLALELRPAALDDLGLETALSNYIEEWAERTGFQAHFHAAGGDPGLRLPPDIETALYRVAQEALANIARHAVGASKVSVLLSRDDERVLRQAPLVRLIVTDDGPGFDPTQGEPDLEPEAGKPWRGLTGIRERLDLLGGTLDIESEPGEGTTLFASVPLPPGQPSAESEEPPLSGGYIAVSPRAA